jgi:hypothetical protein
MDPMATIEGIPGYIDVFQAARIIGRSYSQTCRYIEDGLLPARRVGAQRLVRKRDAETFTPPPRGNPEFRQRKASA